MNLSMAGPVAAWNVALAQAATEQIGVDWPQEMMKGGWVMVVLLLLSVAGMAVAFERLFHLRSAAIAPRPVLDVVLGGQRDFEKVAEASRRHPSTLGRVALLLIDAHRRGADGETVNREASDLAAIELKRHLQKSYPLAIVATLAPLLGLLGTVIGMIESFHIVSVAGEMPNPGLLAGSIAKALVTTAGGLCVAIPALALYHWFKSRLAAYGIAIDEAGNRLQREFRESR